MNNLDGTFDITRVMAALPHRYPFLLLDRVIEFTPSESITALKNVTINEPFFQGHFPQQAVMPGVLILESMAQSTGVLAYYSHSTGGKESVYYLVGIDKARFKRPVVPGDQLVVHSKLLRKVRGIYRFEARATVGDKLVATADFMTTEMEAQA